MEDIDDEDDVSAAGGGAAQEIQSEMPITNSAIKPAHNSSHQKTLFAWNAATSGKINPGLTVDTVTARLTSMMHNMEYIDEIQMNNEIEEFEWMKQAAGPLVTEVSGEIIGPVVLPKTLNLKSFRYTALTIIPTAASVSLENKEANEMKRVPSTGPVSPNRMKIAHSPNSNSNRAGSQYFADPDELVESVDQRDLVMKQKALRYCVAFLDMPEDVAGRYMCRRGREEDAYRAACGKEFVLELFPPRLLNSNAFSYTFDGDDDDDDDGTKRLRYRPEFVWLSRISVSVRIRRVVLLGEIDTESKKFQELADLRQLCYEKRKMMRKRLLLLEGELRVLMEEDVTQCTHEFNAFMNTKNGRELVASLLVREARLLQKLTIPDLQLDDGSLATGSSAMLNNNKKSYGASKSAAIDPRTGERASENVACKMLYSLIKSSTYDTHTPLVITNTNHHLIATNTNPTLSHHRH